MYPKYTTDMWNCSDPCASTIATGWESKGDTFRENAKHFCELILRKDFEEEYSYSFAKFAEDYCDAIFFYNFGCDDNSSDDIGSYQFYPSAIHVNRGKVILEDVDELASRIYLKTHDSHKELYVTDSEKAFPLVLPLCEAQTAGDDWIERLKSAPAVAVSLAVPIREKKNMGTRILNRRRCELVELQCLSTNECLLATTMPTIHAEPLICLAMMAGCISLRRSAYDSLRLLFRDYIRKVLHKIDLASYKTLDFAESCCITNGYSCSSSSSSGNNSSRSNNSRCGISSATRQTAVINASVVQSVLDEPILGFGAFTRIRNAFDQQIRLLSLEIHHFVILSDTSVKVLNDLLFVILQRLLALAPAVQRSRLSDVWLFEFDAAFFDSEFASTITTVNGDSTQRTDTLVAILAAKDETEMHQMQRFQVTRSTQDNDFVGKIVDEAGIDIAIGQFSSNWLASIARKDVTKHINAFERSSRTTCSIKCFPGLIFIPEYVAISALECCGITLTAKASIALAAVLECYLADLIECGGNHARHPDNKYITPFDLQSAIINDNELAAHFGEYVLRDGGSRFRHMDYRFPLNDFEMTMPTWRDSTGTCLQSGFVYAAHRWSTFHDPVAEFMSCQSRQQRKQTALSENCVDRVDFQARSLPTECSLDANAIDIFDYGGYVERCRATLQDNALLCIDRDCLEHIIDEYFLENNLSRLDIALTHEALNLLQTAAESNLVTLLQLARQSGTNDVEVSADDFNAAVSSLALWKACRCLDIEGAVKLIASGANVNVMYSRKSPLMMAAQKGCLELVRMLVEAGANIDAVGSSTALLESCHYRQVPIIHFLLTSGASTVLGVNNAMPPLFVAIKQEDSVVVELLLRYGADINQRHKFYSALHELCIREMNVEIAELLIFQGIDTEIKDAMSRTAIECVKSDSYRARLLEAIEIRNNPGLK